MKNKGKKVKAYYSIDKNLYDTFEKYISDNYIDKSKFIEFLIRDFLNKKDNTK